MDGLIFWPPKSADFYWPRGLEVGGRLGMLSRVVDCRSKVLVGVLILELEVCPVATCGAFMEV